jgi:hypothetical protein
VYRPHRKILRLRLGRYMGAKKHDCQCGACPKSLANGHAFFLLFRAICRQNSNK